jgi:hypothetical protein
MDESSRRQCRLRVLVLALLLVIGRRAVLVVLPELLLPQSKSRGMQYGVHVNLVLRLKGRFEAKHSR